MASAESRKLNTLIAFLVLTWLVLAPLCVWCSYRYYQHRNHIVISKRYPTVVLCFCFLAVLSILFERALYVIIWVISKDSETNSDIPTPLLIAAIICNTLLNGTAPWLICTRYWLIYYEVRWTKSTLNKEWKVHINYLDIDKDWFLSHRATFGNAKYITKRVLIITFSVAILTIIYKLSTLNSYNRTLHFLIMVTTGIVPLITMLIIGFKMRKFSDKFYIMKEFKAINILIYVSIGVYILVIGILQRVFGWDENTRTLHISFYMVFQSAFFVLIQTVYILYHVKDVNRSNDEKYLIDIIANDDGAETRSRSNSPVVDTDDNDGSFDGINSINITDTLLNEQQFELFMQHLSKEWSMELLLALLEISQLQQQIQLEYDEDSEIMKFEAIQQALLNNYSIPSSYIVCHDKIQEVMDKEGIVIDGVYDMDDKMTDFKIRTYALYSKYIHDGDLQINISYEQKRVLSSYVGNINYYINNINVKPDELFNLYSIIIKELTKLLANSHFRYSIDRTPV